jgi:hypothetical protein
VDLPNTMVAVNLITDPANREIGPLHFLVHTQ